jgi:hypothetical protein
VPDLSAFDFEADDAGALDGDDEVDLVVLEMVGDTLPRNDEVVGLKLLDQRLLDVALGPVGEARSFGGRDRHTSSTTTASSSIRSSATAIPRLNNVWMTTVGQTRDRNSSRWPGLQSASQRESRGIMRGRGVIAGALAVCGAVALPGPARADQFDFVMQLDNMGVSYASIIDMIDIGKAVCHELRSGSAPPVVLGKLQATGFAASESAIILVSAVNNMCVDTKPAVVGWARDNGYTGPV